MIMEKQETSQAEDIVKQYYGQIYRFCYLKTSNKVQSQDLTQEIFCRFFQRFETYQKEKKIQQIIFTIAHNLCIDYYRKNAHRELSINDEDLFVCKKNIDNEKQSTLLGILNRLPSQYLEPLVLHYYYDFKIKEIAIITKVSVPNTKYRMKAGKLELKKQMEKEGMTYEEWF